jgi:hypothetical protein
MIRHNQRNNSNSNSNSNNNKSSSSSSSSSNHTGFTSSRVLILLGCLICLAFGLNVYISIIHDPTKTKNSNVEPIVDALLKNSSAITIKKPEVDDDLIQAITSITTVKVKSKPKVKKEPLSTSSANVNVNVNVDANVNVNVNANVAKHQAEKTEAS